jgi:hypothetical protein
MKTVARFVAMAGIASLTAGIAQAQVTNVLTFALTAQVQGSSSDNNGVTVTAKPSKVSINNKKILDELVSDGVIASSTGAKLIVVDGAVGVMDKSGTVTDISSIISLNQSGANDVTSGSVDDTTGLSSPSSTDLHLVTITFDDTGSGGNVSFSVTGLDTQTTTDSKPNATTGAYTETQSHKVSNASGEGTAGGDEMVVTGTVSAKGKGTISP